MTAFTKSDVNKWYIIYLRDKKLLFNEKYFLIYVFNLKKNYTFVVVKMRVGKMACYPSPKTTI